MNKVIPPTVGRKVWFWPSIYDLVPSSKNTMGAGAMRQCTYEAFDATILCVHSDRCVNLLVIDHTGVTHFVSSATLVQPGDDKPVFGYAEWMPYQVGQAEKAAPVAEPAQVPAQAQTDAPRTVTQEQVDAEIVSEHYFTAADGAGRLSATAMDVGADGLLPAPLHLLTFCVLVLRNGFTVTGQSACADPLKFDARMGREWALKDAKGKVWPLLGFRLRDELAAA